MKKKVVILSCCLLLIIVAVVAVVCVNQRSNAQAKTGTEPFTEQEKEELTELYGDDYVYSFIDIYQILNSDKFIDASVKKKIKMLKPVLKDLKKSGKIQEYIIDTDGYIPNVYIVNNNGVSMIVNLEDFPEGMN